ncbi:MAG: pilus assembly protein [Acetobacteraceae bacterium]|nr:pilus assembly protein [Acetobacteraceae bacterium]
MEFALLLPVLVVITLSLTDVTNAVITWWRLSAAANAIARIGTSYAATESNTNSLSTSQATTASTAIFAVIPGLTTAPLSQYGVTLSSVVMTPTVAGCTSNCTYTANTAWSVVVQGTAGAARPCGPPPLGVAANDASASINTLPPDAFSSSPLLVVDVTYEFIPLFTNLFGVKVQWMETAYMAPRTGTDADWIQLTGAQAAQAQCPGYTG